MIDNQEGSCTLATPAGNLCFEIDYTGQPSSGSPQQYQECSPGFLYPWFGKTKATYRPWVRKNNKPAYGDPTTVPGWTIPTDSQSRRMFRLPVADITKMQCSPSPFINAGHANDPTALRPRKNLAGFMVPCNDLMTQVRVRALHAAGGWVL